MTRQVFLAAIFATVGLAGLASFAHVDVFDRPWARLLVAVALAGTFALAPKSSTFRPEDSPTFIPPALLRPVVPAGAATAVALHDLAPGTTHVVYWAMRDEDGGVDAGMVDVIGGAASLRMRCPASSAGSPRAVKYRTVRGDGSMSEVRTAFVKC